MSDIKFVQTNSYIAQFSKIKRLTSIQNLKSQTQKNENRGNYPVSRRFGKYSFIGKKDEHLRSTIDSPYLTQLVIRALK